MTDALGIQSLTSPADYLLSTSVAFESALDRFHTQSLRHPQDVAVVSGEEEVTYGEIAKRASALTAALVKVLEGRRSCPIGVCTDSTLQLVIAALASWKAGCSYLPVSPSSPVERLRHMLTDANAPVVLVPDTASTRIPDGPWKLLGIDESTTAGPTRTDIGAAQIEPYDVAYVIYTSGSTGTPKGVAVTHANLSNLVSWYESAFGLTREDRTTQMRALTFDVSVAEIWPQLSAGARIYSLDRSAYLVPERLRDFLVAQEITICEAPTIIVEQLLTLEWPKKTKLRYLLTGGEALRVFPPPGLPFQLANSYGPTECTVITTSGVITAQPQPSALPSIGRPITGAEVFILDPDFRPVPDGQSGEMFIAGAGVAAGYLGRRDLTDDRFLTMPGLAGGSRIYRTGDIGRRLPNGEFEFCGRIDDQIKLRGYRIEPAEIVAAFRTHPAVAAAAVTTVGEAADKQLVAYLVLKTPVSGAALRNHLALYVPAYMIPELFVPLPKMPLTQNGKVDYSALPVPDPSLLLDAEHSTSEPTTEIELEVAAILSKVLKRSSVGFKDNFFRLGGNSLLAVQVVINLQRAFGVELPMLSVFEFPTVEGLAREIENQIVGASTALSAE